jgi:hypothetical protein
MIVNDSFKNNNFLWRGWEKKSLLGLNNRLNVLRQLMIFNVFYSQRILLSINQFEQLVTHQQNSDLILNNGPLVKVKVKGYAREIK